MTRQNVEASLNAVKDALEHFVSSLDRAGFAEGAAVYRQMAEVIVGQWMWVQQSGNRDLEPRFLRLSELAENIASQLRPYVGAMDQLRGLRGFAAETLGIEVGSIAEKIIDTLMAADRSLTATDLQRATGATTAALRRELSNLASKGLVVKDGGTRGRFALASGRQARRR